MTQINLLGSGLTRSGAARLSGSLGLLLLILTGLLVTLSSSGLATCSLVGCFLAGSIISGLGGGGGQSWSKTIINAIEDK